MKKGLQIFDTEHVDEVKAQGFDLVRMDCQHVTDPLVLIQPCLDAGLEVLAILREVGQLDTVPEGLRVEVGNEPDLETAYWTSPAMYAERCDEFLARSAGRHRFFFGAVSNLNDRGFNYLKKLPWNEWGPEVGCSVHRYPDHTPETSHMTSFTWKYPFRQYWTRDQETAYLRTIVGGQRPLALSEMGYNKSGHTRDEQAAGYAYEAQHFAKHGFEFGIAYQIHSGTGDEDQIGESYGFRDHNTGEWRTQLVNAWLEKEA